MNSINYITGNILNRNTAVTDAAETDDIQGKGVVVCHQVNCQGVMGAGLAKQIRDRFPGVFNLYKEKCKMIKHGIGGLGDVQYACVLADEGYILANVFGQDEYGRNKCYTDYNALRTAFRDMAMGFPNHTIRIPYKMGCGLGGGDWNVVLQIINEELINKGVRVEVWTLV